MRNKSGLAVSLTVLLAVTPAGTAAAQTTSAAAPGPAQKLLCIRGQAETGSHFGASKICHTESEWAMIRSQSGRTMENYQALQNRQQPTAGH